MVFNTQRDVEYIFSLFYAAICKAEETHVNFTGLEKTQEEKNDDLNAILCWEGVLDGIRTRQPEMVIPELSSERCECGRRVYKNGECYWDYED